MLKNKYFYLSTILWIAVIAFGFNLSFDQANASQIPMVITLIGVILGSITTLILKKLVVIDSKEKK